MRCLPIEDRDQIIDAACDGLRLQGGVPMSPGLRGARDGSVELCAAAMLVKEGVALTNSRAEANAFARMAVSRGKGFILEVGESIGISRECVSSVFTYNDGLPERDRLAGVLKRLSKLKEEASEA